MTTTVVTGTGRRSSTRPPELQIPAKTSISQSMTSPIDKFPPFSDEPYDTAAGQGEPQPSSTIRYAPRELWEPRKTSAFMREHGNESTRISKHRPRKSVSEAISTIRTRNASVSANAQELAQALRAPVSYQLIVRLLIPLFTRGIRLIGASVVPLSYLVHDLSRHKHIVEIHP